MHDFIKRLIDCGFQRDTAVFICRYLKQHSGMDALSCYVDEVEKEYYGDLEEVFQ